MAIELDLSNKKPEEIIELNFDIPSPLGIQNATDFVAALDSAWDKIAEQIDTQSGEGTPDRYFLVHVTYNQKTNVFFVHKQMCYVVGYSVDGVLTRCTVFSCNDLRYAERVKFDLLKVFSSRFGAVQSNWVDFSQNEDLMAFFAFIISEAAREESARLGVKQALFTLAGKDYLFPKIDNKTPARLRDYRQNYMDYAHHSLIILNWSQIAEKQRPSERKPDVYRRPITFGEIQAYFKQAEETQVDGLKNLGLA